MFQTTRCLILATLLGASVATNAIAADAIKVGDPNQPTALPAALAKAYSDGAREIAIVSGTYVMPITGSNSIILDSWKDATVHADGVTIVEEGVTSRPVQLRHCERVIFEGALIRYASPSFTQGRIAAIRKQGKETIVDWLIDKGYEIPTGEQLPSMDVADQKTRLLRVGTGDFHCAKIERIKPSLLRLHAVTDGIGTAQERDWIFTRISRGGLVSAGDCTGCTFRKITLQNAGFAAFFEGGGGGNRFLDCRVMPGPRPPGATEDQLVGCGADGFHSTGTSVGPDIERCSWEGLLHDDCIAIHGSFQTVAASEGNKLILEPGRRGGFAVGEPVRISGVNGYHAEFICTGLRDIRKKVEYCEYKLLLREETVPITVTVRKGSQPEYANNERVHFTNGKGVTSEFKCKGVRTLVREEEFAELTLDGKSGARAGMRASNPRRNGAGYKILNCTLGNCRSRGILVKGDNGLIEGNTISGCGMSAISIGPEFGWGEADYCRNVIVRGNKLSGNVANAGGCGVVLVHGDGAMGNRGISIVDNVFEGNYGHAEIRMDWTEGGSITGNKFSFPQGKTQCEAIVNLVQSRKISLKDNTITNAAPGLVPVKLGINVEGLEGNDAKGFQSQPGNQEELKP